MIVDTSPEMVKTPTMLTGRDARLLSFDAFDFDAEFDGIWACASLLHVARQDLGSVLARLARALKPNGVLYASFKYGDGERMEDGRLFNDLNEELLHATLANCPPLDLVRTRVTEDVRHDRRGSQRWLNSIVRLAGGLR